MAARDIFETLQHRPAALLWAFVRRVYHLMVERFSRNNILTYASAMGLQLLTAIVPLALLALLLIGRFAAPSIWREQIGPQVALKTSVPTYRAIDAVVEGLISGSHPTWLAFAVLITLWEVSGAVRTAMGALNCIFEHEESRPIWHRFGLSFAIAAALATLTLGALVIASRGGGWVSWGAAQPAWAALRWLAVVVLLWAAVGLLFRVAPAGEQPAGWVSGGSILVVVAWIVASLIYRWWILGHADYKTPFGTAIAILTLVGYLYTSSIVFLVGAQVDQLLLEQAEGDGRGPLDDLL
jgi:membrane protein